MRLASNFAIERHVCAGLSGRPDELEGALEDGTGRKTTGDGDGWRKELGARVVVRFARGRASSPSLLYVCARTLLHYTLFFSEMNGSESDVRGRGDEAREISSEFAATYV